jgi:hypothetical protein
LEEKLKQVEEREKKVFELENQYKAFVRITFNQSRLKNNSAIKTQFQPLSSRFSNDTTMHMTESRHLTRHMSLKSDEQAYDESSK